MEKVDELSIDGVELIGFRLNRKSENPNVYILITYGDEDIPLTSDGELIFLSSVDNVPFAFNMFSEKIKQQAVQPTEVSLILDIPLMLHLLENKAQDKDATIINCLNIIFDLLEYSQSKLPENYKQILYALADHLTFDSDIEAFIKQKQLTRTEIVNGVLWCIGAILTKTRLLV